MDAAAVRKSRRTRQKSLPECATEKPSALPWLCASKIATGPTGKKSCPSRPPRTIPARKNSSPPARDAPPRAPAGPSKKLSPRDLGAETPSHTVQVGHVKLDRAATWEEIR